LTLGEVRQGALEGVLVEAVAQAAGLPSARVRRAAMLAGDAGIAAGAVLLEGEAGLNRYRLDCFRPVQPMLAEPARDVDEAMERLGRAALELKLDGARVQAHKVESEVRVFTRNLNEVTPAVPEVVDAVRSLPARTAILDGEVVALGPGGRPEPFQVTMRRFGRRLEVERLREEIPLTPFFFDLLLLDGRELVDRPQAERFAELVRLVPSERVVPALVTADREAARAFFQRALDAGHEGLVAKALDAPYDAGRRGQAWLKVKQARTLDLVILAAEWGSGRRRGWLSNLHLGAAAPERNGFVMLGKTFKGLTDEMLEWQTGELLAREVGREGNTVFARPELVAEVAFNDVQESPHYPGGLALRFARVKAYRPDKTADQADRFTTVQRLYQEATGRAPPPVRWSEGPGNP
jgi:DNA ligase-1